MRRDNLGLAPEAALTAMTAAAVIGLARLFSTGAYLGPVLLAAVLSHGVATLARRRGWGLGVAAALSALGVVLYVAWVIEPSTTIAGLPTARTWHLANADLSRAWRHFGEAVAPVAPERGYVLAAGIAVWGGAFVSDWAAFRLGAAFEAMVPPFTLFVFASALGADKSRLAYAGLFLLTALLFLLLQGADQRSRSVAWFASRLRGGPRAIVQGGAVLAVGTVAAALVLGPLLPGAKSAAVLDWRNHDSGGSRVTVSPLVDIRSRLVSQSNVEVFTVKSGAPAYWRLTSLDTFDGQIWGSRGSYRDAGGNLRLDQPTRADVLAGVQEFSLEALDTPWLPAAYRPERYDGPGGVSFDSDSASLLSDADTSTGLTYRVRSELPRLTAAQLGSASAAIPASVRARYTALPGDFPGNVTALAHSLTDRQPTAYAKSLALQQYFRSRFTYSTEVPAGHGENAIERFLALRRGYCEQFAGTFAAMARAVGLPARVAVGFTPGMLEADGLWHVTGRQAHAWPEVFVNGYGWVAFEPTPGRGAPGAEAYTGVPAQQDVASGDDAGATTPVPTTAAPDSGNQSSATTRPKDIETTGGPTTGRRPSPWPGRLVVVWLIGVPVAHVVRGRRRRATAATAEDRTLVAWAEVQEALAAAGVARRADETNVEYARRAAPAVNLNGLLTGLAVDATAATFAGDGISEELAERAELAAAGVVSTVRSSAGRLRRARWLLDPRPLLGWAQPGRRS